ncbi:ABC-type transport system permease protein (probable substrate zinc) [Natrialba magadii ATCC 43099]|uniref:ABC-type transport system permease protein (Probable substrate zinc) n=1 Tax=Natrialba magadii (strain ATCC 43099 / DSM 3394 / CCM 3739 / CIP 104546 / IAM 13178 / JCM 8861 / NBRC 102185 / NCIMB 2190 / MS3) TaxID=547559 RepID=D3SVG9_NATMM|nr:metal ABC transporter permease [Natrialba magadii]ADD05577.1 ABC-type transport system permease protein (probable substrate zinc) [Natrialba magadii ATCC 43099]ELY30008.1 metal ABC transporter permease [Natrialba magadii ATCC 43099]
MSADENGPIAAGEPAEWSRSRFEQWSGYSLRKLIELVGAVVTIGLAVAMLGFITLDWLRFAPEWAVIGSYAELLLGLFLTGGAWLDTSLGTNVFQYFFTWRVIATGVLVGIAAPLIGTFLIHRQMALIGETLAHTAFTGVAIGVLLVAVTGWTGSLLFVALIVSVLGALVLQWLTEHTAAYGDVPIAIVLSGSFAIGTLLVSWSRDFASVSLNIEGFLFGSLAIITAEGTRMVAILTVAVVAVVAVTYKQLLFITFDEQAARVARLNVDRYNTLLIGMAAVIVVGAMQILGVILVAAMLVIPVATASQIANSFRETLLLSVLFGQGAVLGGLAFSIRTNLPPGGSIVVAGIVFYGLTIVLSDRSAVAISTH